MLKLFSNKSYTLLFLGGIVSEIGSTLYIFAIGIFILEVTGSSLETAMFMSLSLGIRVVVSPIAGVLVDKWNRVRVIYLTDFLRGIALLVATYLIFSGVTNDEIIKILYFTTIPLSILGAFFSPAVLSAIPDIVGEDSLQEANGMASLTGALQNIIGLVAGAMVYGFLGIEWVVIINAVSFILSGFSEMFIKQKYMMPKLNNDDSELKSGFFSDIKFGFTYILSKQGLLALMIFSLILNFAFTPLFSNGIPYLFIIDLEKSEFVLANTQVIFSVAMLFASILVSSIVFTKVSRTIKFAILSMTITFSLVALLSHLVTTEVISYTLFLALFIVSMVLLAIEMVFVNVPLMTTIMKIIEPEVRGRVFSILTAVSAGAIPISVLMGGYIIDNYNITILGIVCVSILTIPTVGVFISKSIAELLDNANKIKVTETVEIEEV